jgi:hypothetical protein
MPLGPPIAPNQGRFRELTHFAGVARPSIARVQPLPVISGRNNAFLKSYWTRPVPNR